MCVLQYFFAPLLRQRGQCWSSCQHTLFVHGVIYYAMRDQTFSRQVYRRYSYIHRVVPLTSSRGHRRFKLRRIMAISIAGK